MFEIQQQRTLNLGVPVSNAINMFYRQIVLHRGLPFAVQFPAKRLANAATMTDAELDAEVAKGFDEIATISYLMNEQTENIGARRLHTVMEKLLEDVSFNVPNPETTEITIDEEYVKDRFRETISGEDLDRYIL